MKSIRSDFASPCLEAPVKSQQSFDDFLSSYLYPHQRLVYDDVMESDCRSFTYVKARQRGLSTVLAAIALKRLPLGEVRVYTKDYTSAATFYKRVRALLRMAGMLGMYHCTKSPYSISLDGCDYSILIGSFGAEVKPGDTVSTLILDEAAYLGQDFFDVISPSCSTVRNAKVIMSSTPGLRFGVYYNSFVSAVHLPKDVKVSDEDAISRNLHEEFKDEYFYGRMLDPKQYEIDKARMSPYRLRSEYDALWIEKNGEVFGDVSTYVLNPMPPIEDEVIFAIDPGYGSSNDYTAIALLGVVTGRFYAVALNNEGGVDGSINWCLSVYNKLIRSGGKVCAIVIEGNAVGKVFIERFRSSTGARVYDDTWSSTNKVADIDRLSMALAQHKAWLPDDERVLQDFVSIQRGVTPSGGITYNAPQGTHDDCVSACAHAYAYRWNNYYNQCIA